MFDEEERLELARVGSQDAFERRYSAKFRALVAEFGEFVAYERDRGPRDIGLHLTARHTSGSESLTTALCWFQLKGIQAATLTASDYEGVDEVTIRLEVEHLRFWYLLPTPTYLALYVESAEEFLILNLQRYAADRWASELFSLKQQTVTVQVPKKSRLDEQAFRLIQDRSDVKEWARVFNADQHATRLCQRDYNIIWRLASAESRGVATRMRIIEWQSKTRGEVHIEERDSRERPWRTVRQHWQYRMSASRAVSAYPYLDFQSVLDETPPFIASYDKGRRKLAERVGLGFLVDEDDYGLVTFQLPSGELAYGVEAPGEFHEYVLMIALNALGQELAELVDVLLTVGIVEVSEGDSEMISVAPWHHRAV